MSDTDIPADDAARGAPAKAGPNYDAIVIGAGFAGMFAVHKLVSEGFRVLCVERGDDVGGVWYWNRYPGARCDCESYYYSYSFSDELQKDWSWSKLYSEQPEILRYLEHVADRFDLRRHTRFGTSVTAAHYDEDRALWSVDMEGTGAGSVTARFLIAAAGCLSQRHVPAIPGIEDFTGELLLTSAWPQQEPDLAGKRVGVIGTGASGVQVVTRIAPQVGRLAVFQRTANWVIPVWNKATPADFEAWTKSHHQEIRARCESSWRAVPYESAMRRGTATSPEDREAVFEEHWQRGGPFFLETFVDMLVDREINDAAMDFITRKIRGLVPDAAIADRLTPSTHRLGARRPVMEDGYYETFNRSNVDLVDIAADPIRGFDGKELLTEKGRYPLDTLILATGFDGVTGALTAIDIRGRGGVALKDAWRDGVHSYLGIGVAGFPNFFTVTGPLSPAVLVNMPTALEQHVDWISDCLVRMRDHDQIEIEPRAEAQQGWSDHVTDLARGSFFEEASSWYVGSNIPGKRKQFLLYPGGFARYKRKMDGIADEGYDGFDFTQAQAQPA